MKLLLALFLPYLGAAQRATFPIVTKTAHASIIYDKTGPKLDSIAAHLLAEDIARVTSFQPAVITDPAKARGNLIVIGGEGSSLVQKMLGRSSFAHRLKGQWESFALTVVEKPSPAVPKALVIAGSDARGTAYGVFTLSEKLGVSPWYWWADVPVKKQEELAIRQPDSVSPPPSVRYRGIFINDEDWGLRPWAANTFEPEVKNIGPRTYAKVFELLLRLKANLLWPAMHPGTAAFFSVPGNKETAAMYSIVIGSSHSEPMLRNNVGEWDERSMGPFNYLTNKEKIDRYWEDRVRETSGNEVIYTMGIRGVHDSRMEGIDSAAEAVPVLEEVFSHQRQLLEKYRRQDATTIPQVFTPYKEVLEVYDQGLRVPGDITLVWPDDNYGYIQRLSNEQEQKRSGGSGVYYHASYWGRPHDYLWLSSTHPAVIREEMMKAYANGATRVWVLNVGDIKPLEYNIQLFLDMACNIDPFRQSGYTEKHLLQWNERIFGKNGRVISNVLWNYYDLAFERRPEFMGWGQTEPTTPVAGTAYDHFYYGDEAQRRIDRYAALEMTVDSLRNKVTGPAAFYELVYYPVVSAAEMNKKMLYRDKAYLYAKQNRLSAYDYAALSRDAYHRIETETDYFNHGLEKGKWNYMMSMRPRDLPVFQPPVLPAIGLSGGQCWGIAPEGTDTLPGFTQGLDRMYFTDVFLCDSTTIHWKAIPSAGWITLSATEGTLFPEKNKDQTRVWVGIDWAKAPRREYFDGQISFTGERKHFTVKVHAFRPGRRSFDGYIESNGYVSVYAQHYTALHNPSGFGWQRVEGLGHTGAAMMSFAEKQPDTTSCLSYAFFTFREAASTVVLYALPTLPLNGNYRLRCAMRIDDGPLQTVDLTANSIARTEEWKQNVLSNTAVRKVPGPRLSPGKHTLRIYAIDPGVILDRMVIDLGGMKPAYGVIAETKRHQRAGCCSVTWRSDSELMQ